MYKMFLSKEVIEYNVNKKYYFVCLKESVKEELLTFGFALLNINYAME